MEDLRLEAKKQTNKKKPDKMINFIELYSAVSLPGGKSGALAWVLGMGLGAPGWVSEMGRGAPG